MKYIRLALCLLLIISLVACGGPKEVADMPCSVTIGDNTMAGLFTGIVENDEPNGQGTFIFSDESESATYTGTWKNSMPIGEGTLIFDGLIVEYGDSSFKGTYEGTTINGIPSGNGTFTASNEDVLFIYSGEWNEGEMSGKGELEYSNLAISYSEHTLVGSFKGSVVDGLPCGEGAFSAETEDKYLIYLGNWVDGTFAGNGKLDTNLYTIRFTDGATRIGEFSGETYDGLAEGEGTFSTVNSEGIRYTYTGAWDNGLFNGQGIIQWDDDWYSEKGTFVDGEFFPTPAEYFTSRGTYPDQTYTISDNAMQFLEKYPNVFMKNEVTNEEIEYEQNFQYKAFAKNPGRFGSKLITVSGLKVVQIFENEYWGAEHTNIIAHDVNYNVYYVYLYGYCENVYENSYIQLTALPLDYFTYPNTSGKKIWAIACAGVVVE